MDGIVTENTEKAIIADPQSKSVHFTSTSNEWATPQEFFDRLNEEFRFTLDAAATPENAKCERFFTFRENGLAQSWAQNFWLNVSKERGIIDICQCGCHTQERGDVPVAKRNTRGLRIISQSVPIAPLDCFLIASDAKTSEDADYMCRPAASQGRDNCLSQKSVPDATERSQQQRNTFHLNHKCFADLILGVGNACESVPDGIRNAEDPIRFKEPSYSNKNAVTHSHQKDERQSGGTPRSEITEDKSVPVNRPLIGVSEHGSNARPTGSIDAPTAGSLATSHRTTSYLWQIQTVLAQCPKTSYLRVQDVTILNKATTPTSGVSRRYDWQLFETTLTHCQDCLSCLPIQIPDRVFVNPPYGSDIAKWVEKAATEPSELTVMLVPARTDTRWWSLFWDYDVHKPVDGCEVRFIKGRLKFGGGGQ